MSYHAAVWLDHKEARIIAFDMHDPDRTVQVVESHGAPRIHHKAGTMGSGHAHDAPAYFQHVADQLRGFREILILGPAEAKTGLMTYLRRECPQLALHITGSEAFDQHSDGEIVEFARAFFRRADRMTPQR